MKIFFPGAWHDGSHDPPLFATCLENGGHGKSPQASTLKASKTSGSRTDFSGWTDQPKEARHRFCLWPLLPTAAPTTVQRSPPITSASAASASRTVVLECDPFIAATVYVFLRHSA